MNSSPKILVVEDNPSWQENYREALEGSGFEVTVKEDLKTALDIINEKFFHVAIIDLELKGKKGNRDGREVIKRIWSLDEGTRFLVSSAHGELSMFDEFREMGIFSFTQIPDQDQTRIKGLGAYNGMIAKEKDTLEKILTDVNSALDKSWHDYVKNQWKNSPFKIIKGYTAREIQRSLKAGKIEELRPFLSSMVRPLYPWLNMTSQSVEIKKNNGDILAYESICWSRALGHAVVIRFGSDKRFNESLESMKIASNLGGVKIDKIAEMPEEISQSPFRGIIYKADIKFEEYFSPPPTKRST